MKYSVWNGSDYSYYEAPGALRDGVFAPTPRIRSRRQLGVAPEEAAPMLPVGATPAGHGPYALGTIATRKGGALGALELPVGVDKLLFWGALGYVVYRVGFARRKR